MKVCKKRIVKIIKFISSKFKTEILSAEELAKEGNVDEFYFIYESVESGIKYKSKRIRKLDLYRKEITTIDGQVYQIAK